VESANKGIEKAARWRASRLLTQYLSGDELKQNKMGGACGTYARGREATCRGLVEKPEEKRPFGRPRFKWDNIKMDIF
jgi:hypothetical protein